MKICTKCKAEKPLTEFYLDGRGGRQSRCKKCSWEAQKTHRASPEARERRRARAAVSEVRERARASSRRFGQTAKGKAYNVAWKRKKATGMSAELFRRLLEAQGYSCAVCGANLRGLRQKDVHADHCHATKKPRGVLCRNCNLALGMMADNPARLRAAADYLDRHSK